jgi:myo-inositol-1(or 4)-monophosphatase
MRDYLFTCIRSALAGGRAVQATRTEQSAVKPESFGHHAIVTNADFNSQRAILKTITYSNPEALFMTEEHVPELLKGKTITSGNLQRLQYSKVYIIDELDGTSSRRIGHYEWSISVGYLENLVHVAGAVFAPEVFGGALFYASKEKGAFMKTKRGLEKLNVSQNTLRDSYLIFGVDCFLTRYPVHNRLVHILADETRTINSNGSCALPLGLVAAGKADALIQPPQSPWDYAAGKLLVEESGGRIIFYETKNGKITPLEKLEIRHYNPDERAVGFIAANPSLAEQIMDNLLRI